ncbi:MAG TPA: HD domain-containing phosphohydrolase [Myxococcaceae bacterium]|nr:HD domain-containing phosphohydrolase [Myxococcaceae bacterium]
MRLFRLTLLLMLACSIVPASVFGWQTLRSTRALLVRDVQELHQERVKQLRLRTGSLIDPPIRAVRGLAAFPGFSTLPADQQRLQLATVLSQNPELGILTLFDAGGQRVPGLQGFAVHDVRPTEVVAHEQRAMALLGDSGQLRVSEVHRSESSRAASVTLVVPFADNRGAIAAELSLQPLEAMLAGQHNGSDGVAYLVDAEGRRVAAGAGIDGQDLSARPTVASMLERGIIDGPSLVQVGHFGEAEHAVIAAYAVMRGLGWAVVAEQPAMSAYLPVTQLQRQLVWVLLGALAVAAALAALFSRYLTRPIERFRSGAMELAKGSFGVQVEAKQKNELGDLARTFNYMSQQLVAYDAENRGLYKSLEDGYLETIVALANSIDSKDSYTRGHSQRVADISVEIGRELGLTDLELRQLRYGGILHDVGKIGIVDAILCKQARLTDEEMEVMRGHPEIGDQIIGPVSFLAPVRAAVRSHHERWDGSGYPDKLVGEDIPRIARIVACADTFDACTSTRPYQKAMPIEVAVGILDKLSGKQLDPEVVDALKRVLVTRGVRLEGSNVPVKLAS